MLTLQLFSNDWMIRKGSCIFIYLPGQAMAMKRLIIKVMFEPARLIKCKHAFLQALLGT